MSSYDISYWLILQQENHYVTKEREIALMLWARFTESSIHGSYGIIGAWRAKCSFKCSRELERTKWSSPRVVFWNLRRLCARVQTRVKHPVAFCPALELGLGIEFSPQVLWELERFCHSLHHYQIACLSVVHCEKFFRQVANSRICCDKQVSAWISMRAFKKE